MLVAALPVAVSADPCATAAVQRIDANQRAFEEGMRAAARGQWPVAIVILTDLAERSDEPRVRLELARVLYLSGEYRRAKAEFLKVYRRDLPYPVRRSINLYLDQIDQRIGYLQPQVSLIADSNPGRAGASGTYDLLGAPVDYTAPDRRRLGLAYRVQGALPLSRHRARQWLVAGTAEAQAFGDRALNYGAYSLAIRLDDHRRDDRLSVGWRYRDQVLTAQGPFLEYARRFTRPSRQTVLSGSLESDRFNQRTELNGLTTTVAVDRAQDLGPQTSGHAGLGASLASVTDSRSPRATFFAGIGASRSLPRWKTNVVFNLTAARSQFGERDPLFRSDRRDTTVGAELAAYVARPVFGVFPGLVASAERRVSSIDFYTYRRAGMSFDFRRKF